jgi:hypothetical protein
LDRKEEGVPSATGILHFVKIVEVAVGIPTATSMAKVNGTQKTCSVRAMISSCRALSRAVKKAL